MGNQTPFKPGNRLSPTMVRGADGKFAAKAPIPRLVWTDVDAAGEATFKHFFTDGGRPLHTAQFPSKAHPWPRNHLDLDDPITPLQASKLSRGEIIALSAMSVIGIALIVSGLVWL